MCLFIFDMSICVKVTMHGVQALQVLYSEREVSGDVGLPRHWMRDFFLASLCLEVQENQEGLSRLQVLLRPRAGGLLDQWYSLLHECAASWLPAL